MEPPSGPPITVTGTALVIVGLFVGCAGCLQVCAKCVIPKVSP